MKKIRQNEHKFTVVSDWNELWCSPFFFVGVERIEGIHRDEKKPKIFHFSSKWIFVRVSFPVLWPCEMTATASIKTYDFYLFSLSHFFLFIQLIEWMNAGVRTFSMCCWHSSDVSLTKYFNQIIIISWIIH